MQKRIPREYDKRIKLTEEERVEIYNMYTAPGNKLSLKAIGDMYGVGRHTVYYIVHPERRRKNNPKNYTAEQQKIYSERYQKRLKELREKGIIDQGH